MPGQLGDLRTLRATGESLVVVGPGHMGLAAIVAARAQGVGTIIAVGLSRDRLRPDTALRVGADHAVDLESEDADGRVAEATGGVMADVVLDVASGNATSFITAFELVRPGGKVVAAGMKDRLLVGFDINQIPLRHVTVLPGGGFDLSLSCSMINDGKVHTKDLLGESFPWSDSRTRSRSRNDESTATTPCASP